MSHEQTADSACPYVGARAFEEGDRAGYVGREREIELVVNKVLAGRVTVLFGPSGVGKSSLLLAGLIPRIRELCEGGVHIVYRDAWIEGNYLGELQAAVSDYTRISRDVASEDPMPILLIVLDGFEQLLARSTPNEARALIDYLAKLVHGNLDVRIAISLRAEFLSRLDAYRNEFPELMQGRFPLRPLGRPQVRRALVEPARARGMEWDPEFVDRLIADFDADERSDELGETGPQLCFLSEVARRLWDRAQSRRLTQITPELFQGRDEELNGILCEVFADLDEPTIDAAARIVCRLAPPTGRKVPCTLCDLTSEPGVSETAARAVLARLQHQHLVRLRESGTTQWFELTHDALTGFLRRWGEQRLTAMRERAEMLQHRVARRAKRRRFALRSIASCLAAGLLGLGAWYSTMDFRVARETRQQVDKLRTDFAGEKSRVQRARLQRSRIEQYAYELWHRWHWDRERWVLDWLTKAQEQAPDAFTQERPDRSRQVGEPVNCELLAGDEKNLRFMDFSWRTASPVLRRWHVPVTERVPACTVDYLEPGSVALSADNSTVRTAPSRRMRNASSRDNGAPRESRAADGVSEPSTVLRSVKPEMSWDSLQVKDYKDQFERAGLSKLRGQCEPEPWAVADWPTQDCALPRWTRPLLDLATVKYEPMETYYRNKMTGVLLTEPHVIPHADTLVPVLEALRPGSDTASLGCMADTLRSLSFEARKRNRVLPALLPLVDHLADVCGPSNPATLQDRVSTLWKRLDRSASMGGAQCALPPPGQNEVPRPNFEKLGAMLQRLAIFPGVQVHLGTGLFGSGDSERQPNTPGSPRGGELVDDAGRLTPELATGIAAMQRGLYDRDGIVISEVRFDKRTDEDFGRTAIEIVVQGACLSTASRFDLADVPEDARARTTVNNVTEAVRRELASSFQRRELLDAVELLHPNVVPEVMSHQPKMLELLRSISAADTPQARSLMRHASTLLSASLLLRELDPSKDRWLEAAAELGSTTDTRSPASVKQRAARALTAIRAGRVAEARQHARAMRSDPDAARAIAALYPEHVQRTLLAAAERTCSTDDGDRHVTELRSLRSQAQLADWAARPESGLLGDVPASRIMHARLCVLSAATQRQTPFSPSAQERWDLAAAAISSMHPEGANRDSLALALDLLHRSESVAPAALPDDLQHALVRLARDDAPSQLAVVNSLIAEPVARWRVEVALELLRSGREFRWVERALAWMILERSESREDARAVLDSLQRLEHEATGEHAAHLFLIGRAHFRLDETDLALVLFDRARAGAPPWLLEAIADLKAETLVHARRFDEVLRMPVSENEAERCVVRRHQVKALIATVDPTKQATVDQLRRLVEDEACASRDPGEQAYSRAWVASLVGLHDADRVASEVVATDYPDADYIQLFLTGMRALANDKEHGDDMIQARWQQIRASRAPGNWSLRAQQGDLRVWHEKLIAYWVGALNERELLAAAESEAGMQNAGLGRLGLTLSSLQTEAYFYVGLRAATEGRLDDAKAMWRRVEASGRPEYHEYAVARFLTRKFEGSTAGAIAMRTPGRQK